MAAFAFGMSSSVPPRGVRLTRSAERPRNFGAAGAVIGPATGAMALSAFVRESFQLMTTARSSPTAGN